MEACLPPSLLQALAAARERQRRQRQVMRRAEILLQCLHIGRPRARSGRPLAGQA